MNEVAEAKQRFIEGRKKAKEEGFLYYGCPFETGIVSWMVVPTFIVPPKTVEINDPRPSVFFGKTKQDFPEYVLASLKWADE